MLGGTYDLGSAERDLLVVVAVLGLHLHSGNAGIELLDIFLVLLNGSALALWNNLAGLELLLKLSFEFLDRLHALFKLFGLHWLLAFSLKLLVLLVEFLLDFGACFLNKSFVMLLLPFAVQAFWESEVLIAPLLFELWLGGEDHLLDAVLLVSKSLNLLFHLLHLLRVTGSHSALVVTEDGDSAVRVVVGKDLLGNGWWQKLAGAHVHYSQIRGCI